MGSRLILLLVIGLANAQAQSIYTPPTSRERLNWFTSSSFGWQSTAAGVFNSGLFTAINRPPEWHGTGEGFGKRLGTRTTGVIISNGTEAALSGIWGEDPRYRTDHSGTWKRRVGRSIVQGVMAHNRRGHLMPAYGRYAGAVGNNLVTNQWRAPSDDQPGDVVFRIGAGFGGRMIGNGFNEFWPEIRKLIRKIRR